MRREDQAQMRHNLGMFCEEASRHRRRVAIVTGAGGVSRAVARALVQERKYAVLLVSRGVENLNKAYAHALASGFGFDSHAARHGKVVGLQQLDLSAEQDVAEFVDELARVAGTANVRLDLIVHAAGRFAWDDELMDPDDRLMRENCATKFVLAEQTTRPNEQNLAWQNTRQVFVSSVAATFSFCDPDADKRVVSFPDNTTRTQYAYAAAQEWVSGRAMQMKGRIPESQLLVLEPGGMADTETMDKFPPEIRAAIAGHTVRTEVMQPLFNWLDGKQVRTRGEAVGTGVHAS